MRLYAITLLVFVASSCGTVSSEASLRGAYVCTIDNLEMSLELRDGHRYIQKITSPPSARRIVEGGWRLKGAHVEFDRLALPNPYPSSAPTSADRAATLKDETPAFLAAERWYGKVWLIFDPDSDAGFKKQ